MSLFDFLCLFSRRPCDHKKPHQPPTSGLYLFAHSVTISINPFSKPNYVKCPNVLYINKQCVEFKSWIESWGKSSEEAKFQIIDDRHTCTNSSSTYSLCNQNHLIKVSIRWLELYRWNKIILFLFCEKSFPIARTQF